MKKKYFSLLLIILTLITISIINYNSLNAQIIEWNSKQKPACLINKTDDGIYIINNIRWGFKDKTDYNNLIPYWKNAKIDINKVSDVLFVIKPFPPEWIAAHCLLIFKFKEPFLSNENDKSNGLVLSIEARLKKGENYSLVQGNFGKFLIIYQLSTEDDYIEYSNIEKRYLIPYKLKLSYEQKVTLLKYALEEAVKNRDNEKYNTLHNNCTNNLFLLLNKVLPKEQQFKEWIIKKVIYNISISFPRTVGLLLKKHKLVEEKLPPIVPTSLTNVEVMTKIVDMDSVYFKNTDYNNLISESTQKKIINFNNKIDKIKIMLINAINEQLITKEMIINALYDEDAEQVLGLFVPGILPDDEKNTGFVIGKEFLEKINSINNKSQLCEYINHIFESYKLAVQKRIKADGYDISKYLHSNLDALYKGLDKSIKSLKIQNVR